MHKTAAFSKLLILLSLSYAVQTDALVISSDSSTAVVRVNLFDLCAYCAACATILMIMHSNRTGPAR